MSNIRRNNLRFLDDQIKYGDKADNFEPASQP